MGFYKGFGGLKKKRKKKNDPKKSGCVRKMINKKIY